MLQKMFLSVMLTGIIVSSCCGIKTTSNLSVLYKNAIKEAIYPENSKIDSNLFEIAANNKRLIRKNIKGEEHILVVSWKTKNYYPDSGAYNTGSYQIWVSAAPQLKQLIKNDKPKDLNLRLKQLLGLPPNGEYNYFIEFWVKPSDLFRPCPDKEINDKQCNVCFTAKDSLDLNYIKWINDGRISRYYACGLYNQYPWTQLGYTYDWNPKNRKHLGVSEYVVDKNKLIYVERVYTTTEYINN